MRTHGNGLVCGLFMSGSAARGRGTRRSGTRPTPACPRGYKTQAGGGARPLEEAEETRHQGHGVEPLADILRGIPVKKLMAEWTGSG